MKVLSWLLRIVAAVILFQTLFFKFSAAPESVFIFSSIHAEPWGRIASGVVELIAGVLLVVPATQAVGALVAMGVMTGAILTHLLVLGISVEGDGGLLFALACVVWLSSLIVLFLNREWLFSFWRRFKK